MDGLLSNANDLLGGNHDHCRMCRTLVYIFFELFKPPLNLKLVGSYFLHHYKDTILRTQFSIKTNYKNGSTQV